MFEFAYPWIFFILPLPLLVHWLVPPHRESKDSIQVPFFQKLVELSGEKPQKGAVIIEKIFFQKVWLVISWILIVAALAKPQLVGEPIIMTKSTRDLMIAVDLSGSMDTNDFTAQNGKQISRLQAVKSVLKEFVSERKHDRLGLIVFGDSPYLQTPFTEDHDAWLKLLEETDIGMAGQRTMFGDAIGLAIKLFINSNTENRVLIVLTDGNDTGSKVPPIEAAKVAKAKNITIYSIAVGDPETTGEEALDMDVLKNITKTTNGHYYQALDREQLREVYKKIAKLEPEKYETQTYRPRQSLHHYPIAVIVVGYILFFSLMTWFNRKRKKQ